MLPEFVKVAGVSYEVVTVRHPVWQGAAYDCRAAYALRRFYVSSALCLADQRAALGRAIRQTRRSARPWQRVA